MAWFVVPAYNEEANIGRLLVDLESRPELWADGGWVVIADDGSTDATVEVARRHNGLLPIEVLVADRNGGPGKAFDRGFRRVLERAPEDALVVTLESDTTSDLDALAAMLEQAEAGADVVLANHHAHGGLVNVSAHRRFLSTAASTAIRRSAGLDAQTVSNFFRVYRAGALRTAYARYGDGFIRESGFACKAEILIKLTRLDAVVAEVPVSIDWSRRAGESKMRVLPTVRGYARVMARSAFARSQV